MRIAVLAPADDVYANRVVTHLLSRGRVAAILEVAGSPWSSRAATHYVVHHGIRQWITRAATGLHTALGAGRPGDPHFGYRRLARDRSVPMSRIDDVNREPAHRVLRRTRPDLLVGVRVEQRVAPRTARLARLGAVNGHPALLPGQGGAAPVFWTLANGERQAGFSIHRVGAPARRGASDEEVLAQTLLEVRPDDTEHSLSWRLAEASLPLFDAVLDGFARGAPPRVAFATGGGIGKPTLPTRQAVRQFHRQRRRYFRYGEVFGRPSR